MNLFYIIIFMLMIITLILILRSHIPTRKKIISSCGTVLIPILLWIVPSPLSSSDLPTVTPSPSIATPSKTNNIYTPSPTLFVTPNPTPIPTHTNFYDMEPFTEGGVAWYKISKTEIDNTGQTYIDGYKIGQHGEQAREYLLNKQFSSFSGTIALLQRHKDLQKPVTYQIYGDDVLIYELTNFEQGSYPENFTIDVTGVQIMKIRTFCDKVGAGPTTIFSNIELK